ncbi:MAG: hypothetical protein NT175_02705 [Bacteroidetes bacterium]|nr:hypothetical protein [Bacteroidota bacterium]
MALTKGKHIVEEIDGIRCSIVEKGADPDRIAFLKDILEYNKFEVHVQEEIKDNVDSPATFILGVTDIVFNPVIAVYEMSLRTRDGKRVTASFWKQWTTKTDSRYWAFRKPKA